MVHINNQPTFPAWPNTNIGVGTAVPISNPHIFVGVPVTSQKIKAVEYYPNGTVKRIEYA